MPLVILSVVVQVALVVHVLRTGRQMYWIFIIFFMPGIGSIAYLIVELLPEWSGSFRAKKAMRKVRSTFDPGADLRLRKRQQSLSGSVDATRLLARELTSRGQYDEAIEQYEAALTGLYEDDPDLLIGLAEAQFGKEDYARARETMERLIERHPDYRSPEGHLLYARALEECGELEDAEQEYRDVAAYFAGAEARARYGRLLEELGRKEEALAQYEDILASAELAPRHFRKAQKRWIGQAREGVRRLKA